jgi:hypothetical protein
MRKFAATLTCLALLVPAVALAFSVTTVSPNSKVIKRWAPNKITYYLHPKTSEDLPVDKTLQQLKDSFNEWSKPSCTALQFVPGYDCNTAAGQCIKDNKSCKSDLDCPSAMSTKSMLAGYNPDGRNQVHWMEGSDWPEGKFVLGATVAIPYGGYIVESDIALNGKDHKWTLDPFSTGIQTQHVASVAVHEIGHFFGLQHVLGGYTDKDPPTMAPNVAPLGKSASINADDSKAPCFLHPKTGSYTCASDADCPYVLQRTQAGEDYYQNKMVCKSGACQWGGEIGGTVELGGKCASSKQCKPGLFCQPYGTEAFCSQGCTVTKKDCPSGFQCLAYQGGGGKGACMSSGGTATPSKKPGEACKESSECTTLMCLEDVCRLKCTPTNPVECNAAAEECAKLPQGGVGACVPKQAGPQPDKKKLGQICQGDGECASDTCMKVKEAATEGACVLPCTGKGSCPDGYQCATQGAKLGCVPGKESATLGGECSDSKQCDTELCIAANDKKFCSKPCVVGDAATCPCGMACTKTGAGDLCILGKSVACLPEGAACAEDGECKSGACHGGLCRAACTVGSGTTAGAGCQAGQSCLRKTATVDAGVCMAGGGKAMGEACAADTDCESLYCTADATKNNEKRCMQPCATGNASACGPGRACSPKDAKIGACYLADTVPAADAGTTSPGIDAGSTTPPTTTPPATAPTTTASTFGCTARAPNAGSYGVTLLLLAAAGALGYRRRTWNG